MNDIAGIRVNKNFNSLVIEMGGGGFENLPFGEKDCRNFINKARELQLVLREGCIGTSQRGFSHSC
jgi:hypothetical protein